MARFLALFLTIGVFALAMTPIQASAQSAKGASRLFATRDNAHVILVQALRTTSYREAMDITDAVWAERYIKEFNAINGVQAFTNYQRTSGLDHRVDHADNKVVYVGESYLNGHVYEIRLTLSQVKTDVFFVVGIAPTDAYYRYVNACNEKDKIQPAPMGYGEYDMSTGTFLPNGTGHGI